MSNLTAQDFRMDGKAAFDRLLTVITFLLVFIMAARTPLDSDMWWHLSAGEEMLRSGTILRTDIFSFSRFGSELTNPYWMPEIAMAVIFRWQGFAGLSATVALLAVMSLAICHLQCEGPALLKSIAVILSGTVASVVWSPRPQLFSLVFFACAGYILFLYKWRKKNVLWALPFVFVLWANTHGGYPLGLIWIGLMVAGEILNHILSISSENVLPWRKIFYLCLCGIVCGLVVLINPNGFRIWTLPFQTVNMQVLQLYIPEWASPDFHDLLQQSLIWLMMACFVAIGLSDRKVDGSDLLVLLGFVFMALLARRNFGPFALAAMPILCRYGASAFHSWHDRAKWLQKVITPEEIGQKQKKQANRLVNGSIVALLGVIAILKLYIVSHPAVVNGYMAQAFPTEAVKWLKDNMPGERMMNEYNWGGYLQWALPEIPIFVDGRTDLFNDEIIGEWINTVQAGKDWQSVLDRYQVDLIMLQPDRPLIRELGDTGWHLLFSDEQAVIYGR